MTRSIWVTLLLLLTLIVSTATPISAASVSQSYTYTTAAPAGECARLVALDASRRGKPCVITTVVKSNTWSTTSAEGSMVALATVKVPYPYKYFNTYVYSNGPFGAWQVVTYFGGRFNGVRIWSNYVSCTYYAAGFSLDLTACQVWNDGGFNGLAADWGANWTICFVAKSLPFCATHGHREAIDKNGNVVRIARW